MIQVTTTKSAAGQSLSSPQTIYITTTTVVTKIGMVTNGLQSLSQIPEITHKDYIGLSNPTLVNPNPTLPLFVNLQSQGESDFKDYLTSLNIDGVTSITII